MSSRSVSPGGALLRASRIFSIPPTLPRPATNLSSTAVITSDTATLPHPINLSITTPQASLARGDWGFKRPLPLRSTTKSSTPLIRVNAIDTYEQVTDYASSADHTLTLQKWHEMGMHISTPPQKTRNALGYSEDTKGQRSVFDDSIDSTGLTEGRSETQVGRWRFKGPWLAGLTEGDFNTYVMKQVRKRKGAFHKYLRTACAEATTKENQRIALEQGGEIGEPIRAGDITEAQLLEYIQSLRENRTELFAQIRKFLDLPPAPNPALPTGSAWLTSMLDKPRGSPMPIDSKEYQPTSNSPYADSGPPSTHPSAGLSYGRTSAHTFNHPVYGPQSKKPPVQARVIKPKAAARGNSPPLLGVGGFVVNVPAGENSFNLYGRSARNRPGDDAVIPGLLNVEPHKVGGSKAYVNPKSASVDTKGRIILKVEQADPEAIAIVEGRVDEIPRQTLLHSKGFLSKPPTRSKEGYGISSGDLGLSGDSAWKPKRVL
jgi:hypothetical protein